MPRVTEGLGYHGLHSRLVYMRGNANEYSCSTCGEQAKDWALDKDATPIFFDSNGEKYCSDIDYYNPMCRRCHIKYDRRAKSAMNECKNGHAYREGTWYIDTKGSKVCRKCARINQRKYRLKKRSR